MSTFEPDIYLGCLLLPGSQAEKWLCPSRLIEMAAAGGVWSSLTNWKWWGFITNPNPPSPSPLLWENSALHQTQDSAAWLDSWSVSQAVPSKSPWKVSVQLQIRPQILGVIPPHGAGCSENSQPYAGQQSLLSVWFFSPSLQRILTGPLMKGDWDSPRIPRPHLGSSGKTQFFWGQSGCKMGTVMEQSGFWRWHWCFGRSRVGRRVEPGPFSCR